MSERTFLEEITIRSIGVIDQSTLEISRGLTVLSGETGAGNGHARGDGRSRALGRRNSAL